MASQTSSVSIGPSAATTTTGVPKKVPTVAVLTTKVVLSGGKAPVRLGCTSAACRGSVTMTEKARVVLHHGKKTVTTAQSVVLTSAPYQLGVGKATTVELTLTPRGRSALTAALKHPVRETVKATVRGGRSVSRTVVVS